jgi:hypothetical protein
MPEWNALARWTILAGLGLTILGGLIWLVGRTNLPLGRLPGDIRIQTGQMSCFIPLASMLLVSLVLTALVNIIIRLLGK